MSDSVVKPDQLNEKFTLYPNGAGEPVERTLSEMTSGEVIRALKWSFEEDTRLEREAAPFLSWPETMPPDTTKEAMWHAVDVTQASGTVKRKHADLLRMVCVLMPEWRDKKMEMDEAVRRFWPGGRS